MKKTSWNSFVSYILQKLRKMFADKGEVLSLSKKTEEIVSNVHVNGCMFTATVFNLIVL